MKIINKARGIVLANDAIFADNPLSRAKGLLGRKELKDSQAMVLKPCNSIHTFFMAFAIDALFVDKNNKVIAALRNIRPWRMSPVYWRGCYVVELPKGAIESTGTIIGDELELT